MKQRILTSILVLIVGVIPQVSFASQSGGGYTVQDQITPAPSIVTGGGYTTQVGSNSIANTISGSGFTTVEGAPSSTSTTTTTTSSSGGSSGGGGTSSAYTSNLRTGFALGNKIVLLMKTPLDTTSVPASTQFTVQVSGNNLKITSVALVQTMIILYIDGKISASDTPVVSYLANGKSNLLKTQTGVSIKSFSNFKPLNFGGGAIGSLVASTLIPTKPAIIDCSQNFTTPLGYLSFGEEVRKVQEVLYARGFMKTQPTGVYMGITQDAIKAFQKFYKIKVDGTVGPETRAILNQLTCKSPLVTTPTTQSSNSAPTQQSVAPKPVTQFVSVNGCIALPKNLKKGDVGEDVGGLQDFLIAKGYLTGPSNSTFGPRTEEAIKKFQSDNAIGLLAPLGLTNPTGIVGTYTRDFIKKMTCGQ